MAHMYHDSDGNRPLLGWMLFDLLQELNVPSTWCTMPVAGYDRSFYDALIDSTSESPSTTPPATRPCAKPPAGARRISTGSSTRSPTRPASPNIVSNKNHGIAWQGRLEFYYWCQNKGIQLEHSRGDRGFTFGTSHPWLPMEDDRPNGDFLDVLALPFLTQDFTVVCPHGFMRPLVDQCHADYGVAHVLYHPSHVEDPECERSIRETVAYARSLGHGVVDQRGDQQLGAFPPPRIHLFRRQWRIRLRKRLPHSIARQPQRSDNALLASRQRQGSVRTSPSMAKQFPQPQWNGTAIDSPRSPPTSAGNTNSEFLPPVPKTENAPHKSDEGKNDGRKVSNLDR